ncbi:MAG: delta-aminolevulinic acid dehydratase [Bacteroidetes bacterium]|nr:delta-aminolevulinic acid dehydratase [Bacteroidota bacterium]
MQKSLKESLQSLKTYCESENFIGWDPYDGLNSKVFQATPLKISRLARLIWIQAFKKSPVNFRSLMLVPKELNPKAAGLFLNGYCNIYRYQQVAGSEEIGIQKEILDRIHYLVNMLRSSKTAGFNGYCWGYNFDWQARAFFMPKNTPTIVATAFISSALLDAYEITGEKDLLEIVNSSCEFIIRDLNRTYDDNGNFAFSYSPIDASVVYNASFLGSRLLARVYSITRNNELLDAAERSVIFCCDHQNSDGSWSYGSNGFHSWIDNFHTGYNLESLSDYMKYSGDYRFNENLRKGFDYYITTFFTESGVSKYFNNSLYPVDIHNPAQLIITLSRLDRFEEYKDLADKVLKWTIENMQSEIGYFYFQKGKFFTLRTPYIRWAQAWMFYALSEYLLKMI